MQQDSQPDSIHLRGLRLKCHIGVSARERRQPQTITADIALKCGLAKAAGSDSLADTVDYAGIAGKVTALAAKQSFHLLEALAGRVAEICLADPRIRAVRVNVAKKGVFPNVRAVEVEITRKRRRNSPIQNPKSKI